MPDKIETPNFEEIEAALREQREHPNSKEIQNPAPNISQSAVEDPSIHKVEGVQFDENIVYQGPKFVAKTEVPKMVEAVIKYSGGAIKEQKQAEYLLLAFVVVSIVISVFLFLRLNNSSSSGRSAADMFKNVPIEQIPPAFLPIINRTNK